jgi:hypothetical protein
MVHGCLLRPCREHVDPERRILRQLVTIEAATSSNLLQADQQEVRLKPDATSYTETERL